MCALIHDILHLVVMLYLTALGHDPKDVVVRAQLSITY